MFFWKWKRRAEAAEETLAVLREVLKSQRTQHERLLELCLNKEPEHVVRMKREEAMPEREIAEAFTGAPNSQLYKAVLELLDSQFCNWSDQSRDMTKPAPVRDAAAGAAEGLLHLKVQFQTFEQLARELEEKEAVDERG